MSRPLIGVTRWLVALAMPVFIILLWVRIVWNPWAMLWEYGKPDFPPDQYGFTDEQRIEYALQWIDYYNSNQSPAEGIQFFSALRMPGADQPLYSPYEVSHMVDVRLLTDKLWRILPVAGIIVIGGLLLLLIPPATRRDGYAAIFMGGLISTGLLVGVIMFVLLSWRTFFITFHQILFPPGTWTFEWTSTLIRLFPDRFWFDMGVLVVGGALIISVIVTWIGRLLGRRARTSGGAYGTPKEDRSTA